MIRRAARLPCLAFFALVGCGSDGAPAPSAPGIPILALTLNDEEKSQQPGWILQATVLAASVESTVSFGVADRTIKWRESVR